MSSQSKANFKPKLKYIFDSAAPNMSGIEDANSQTGICPMSPTRKDLLALQG